MISHDRFFLDCTCTHMLAFEGEGHVEWFEDNFEDYKAYKICRLGPDAVKPKRIKYKKFRGIGLHLITNGSELEGYISTISN